MIQILALLPCNLSSLNTLIGPLRLRRLQRLINREFKYPYNSIHFFRHLHETLSQLSYLCLQILVLFFRNKLLLNEFDHTWVNLLLLAASKHFTGVMHRRSTFYSLSFETGGWFHLIRVPFLLLRLLIINLLDLPTIICVSNLAALALNLFH